MSGPKIGMPRSALADFCCRNHIRRLALFGSVLHDDFGPESDVDVLVELEPGHCLGFAFFALQDELSEMLGRRVDLNTREDLSRYFRDEGVLTSHRVYPSEAGTLPDLGRATLRR
ncbi:MAG TPA: nucleotidyltransferase family protein [Longimicrobiaceae bacterium]|jgi:predicted nucleotidyltransferase|nr:nucleotidyltransferase family protein [Longimicrobiaceae bacterium]